MKTIIVLVMFAVSVTLFSMAQIKPGQPSQQDGTLVVRITSGDNSNSPAHDVYVEVYGFVKKMAR